MLRCALARTNWLLAMVDVPPHLAEREGRKDVARAGATPLKCCAPEPRRKPGYTLPRWFCWCWERVSDRLGARARPPDGTRPPPRAGLYLRGWRAGSRTWPSR